MAVVEPQRSCPILHYYELMECDEMVVNFFPFYGSVKFSEGNKSNVQKGQSTVLDSVLLIQCFGYSLPTVCVCV